MIYIVLGMHRSGTSLVSGLLHNAGVPMGDKKTFLPKPNHSNKRGFYENIRFRHVNDNILSEHNYSVKSWNTDIPRIETTKLDTQTLIEEYNKKHSTWGAKDPRFSLTLKGWKFAPYDVLMVYPYRNPMEVAKSLRERNSLDIDVGLLLWRIYNERALESLEYYNTYCVNYDDVLSGNSGIPDAKNLIDIKLKHNKSDDIPDICKDTWKLLLDKQRECGRIRFTDQ